MRIEIGLVLLLAACSPSGERVLARLGDEGLATAPAPASRLIGSATRNAVCSRGAAGFDLRPPPRSHRLLLSLGVPPEGQPDPAAVRFAVREEAGGASRLIFEERVAAGTGAWHDRWIELGPDRGGERTLRFQTQPVDGAPEACWGSVILLGGGPGPAPNVILLSLDTLGASYLSSFDGMQGVSPNIDAFLEQSHSFRRAYANYGATFVSHSSLFSGLYPIRHGRRDWRSGPLDSLVTLLAAHGFLTVAFTEDAFVGSRLGFSVGFDHWDDGEGARAERFHIAAGSALRTFANAADWLEAHGHSLPFFLFVHTYEVHSPYGPLNEEDQGVADRVTPDDLRRFEPRSAALLVNRHNKGTHRLASRDIRRLRALHVGEIHALDRAVGAFLQRLADLGLANDTLVVLTSDHGEQFGEQGKLAHGQTLHDRVLHVPLGFRWPRQVESGVAASPVQLVDVLPTVLDLVGIPIPPQVDGRSLAPALRGSPDGLPPHPAFSEQHDEREECARWTGPGPCFLERYAVQTERFKYVSSRFPRYERLYDLREDPLEQRDVAARWPRETERHRALLDAYLEAGARRPPPAASELTLDEATRERLRALGYL